MLAEANIATDVALSLTAEGCRLGTGLDLLLQPHDLAWIVDHEVLLITTKDAANDMTLVRVYPVSDLDDGEEVGLNGNLSGRAGSLKSALMHGAGADSWLRSGGPGSLEYFANARALVVSQTEKGHQQVERLLASIRQAKTQQVPNQPEPPASVANDETLHLKVYRVALLARSSAGVGTGMGGGSGGGMYAVNDDAQKQPEPATKVQQPSSPFDPAQDLVRIIPQVIEPTLWKATGGKGVIESLPGRLIVLQTNRVHIQIAKLLRELQ
jgi:hypothetical protein